MESPTVRERRLQHRRERERAHRAAETAAEKEERLRKCRKRDQERRAAETEETDLATAWSMVGETTLVTEKHWPCHKYSRTSIGHTDH